MAHERMMTVQQVPDLIEELTGLKRTISTVREWCERGYLRSRRIGGRIMVDRDSVREYLLGKEEADA